MKDLLPILVFLYDCDDIRFAREFRNRFGTPLTSVDDVRSVLTDAADMLYMDPVDLEAALASSYPTWLGNHMKEQYSEWSNGCPMIYYGCRPVDNYTPLVQLVGVAECLALCFGTTVHTVYHTPMSRIFVPMDDPTKRLDYIEHELNAQLLST